MAAQTIEQAMAQAVAHHEAGRLAQAEEIYRQVLAVVPQHAEALHFLGVLANQVGQNGAAAKLIGRAIALRPNDARAYCNLGVAFAALGKFDQAIAMLRKAIELKPDLPMAHCNLGNALKDRGALDSAIVAYREAVRIDPQDVRAYNNLGILLFDRGHPEESIASLREAIRLQPDVAHAHGNLGAALRQLHQLDDAALELKRGIELDPGFAEAHANLGSTLKDRGEFEQALFAYRKAVELRPNDASMHSVLIIGMAYAERTDTRAITAEARRWNDRHAKPQSGSIQPHRNDRAPDRRLKIGYVSSDFCGHPVGRFMLPLLASHDRGQFEVHAYVQVRKPDPLTQELRSHVDHWRSILALGDDQAAELIRQDGIDILIDLAGHTANNRLRLFALKPAPIQVAYLGYPATTGLDAIDYRLTDVHADPPEDAERAKEEYSEQLVRLSPTVWCFQMREDAPIVARQAGPITFGCFNTFAKMNEPTLRLWGRVLRAAPDARLLLKSGGLGSERVCRRVRQLFEGEGIAADRLELCGHLSDYAAHLRQYHRVDIALDTFPYHGTTTTCEAMWMGVPVITLAGANHMSRVGVSLLNQIGLGDLAADSEETYVKSAAALANDPPRLAELRTTLRQRMQASPLMDGPRLARNIESAYQKMWRTWCEKNSE